MFQFDDKITFVFHIARDVILSLSEKKDLGVTFMRIRHLALGLSVAVLAVPAFATSNEPITAVGHARNGWLATSGPDLAGVYRVAINVADLDPASTDGWATMDARARRGTLALCDMTADPEYRGLANAAHSRCWRSAYDAARQQMSEARDARQQGRSVATLGMASMPAR